MFEFGHDSETLLYSVKIMDKGEIAGQGEAMMVDSAVSYALMDAGWVK